MFQNVRDGILECAHIQRPLKTDHFLSKTPSTDNAASLVWEAVGQNVGGGGGDDGGGSGEAGEDRMSATRFELLHLAFNCHPTHWHFHWHIHLS